MCCPPTRIELSRKGGHCCWKRDSTLGSHPSAQNVHQECLALAGFPINEHRERFIIQDGVLHPQKDVALFGVEY